MTDLYLGIDVGTGSARAGLFDAAGTMHGMAAHEIAINRSQADFVEQSSGDIWRSCGRAVRGALTQAKAKPEQVKGIGFDATCSLVSVDGNGAPVTVSPSGDDEWNIIVWMDHRAIDQANRINAVGHEVLRYVGGVISPEMELPKLLWLKEHAPETWKRAALFFDLPDWLVFRATGADVRSLCTTVCKWTYLGHEEPNANDSIGRWDETHFQAIGLGDLAEEGFRRIGTRVRPMGERAGGLTPQAAEELGLRAETPVGVAIIDAHAGGLGLIGMPLDGDAEFDRRLALIAGTSSCHMVCSQEPRFIHGIWGPYYSAMIPGLWLNEGGQSATGALIDHAIHSHARGADLAREAKVSGKSVYELLDAHLVRLANGRPLAMLTRDLHVLPDHHGNRSPRADPSLRGVVSGLTLDDSIDALALQYLATVQAVAHGTRHIIGEMNVKGYRIEQIFATGGGTKSPIYRSQHADITGCDLIFAREQEAVLLGAAMLGSVAAGKSSSVTDAMAAMSSVGETVKTSKDEETVAFHDAKHRVFLKMHENFLEWRSMMGES